MHAVVLMMLMILICDVLRVPRLVDFHLDQFKIIILVTIVINNKSTFNKMFFTSVSPHRMFFRNRTMMRKIDFGIVEQLK